MSSTPKTSKESKKSKKKKKEDPNKMGLADSIQLLQIFIQSVIKLGKEHGFEDKAEQSKALLNKTFKDTTSRFKESMICIELLTKGAYTVKLENWHELVREIGETFKARKKQFCEATKKLKEKHSARKIMNLHEKLYQQLEGLTRKIRKLEQKEEALDDENAWTEESNYVKRHLYEKKAVAVYNQIQKLNHESTSLQRAKERKIKLENIPALQNAEFKRLKDILEKFVNESDDLPDIDDYKEIITSWREKYSETSETIKRLNQKAIAAIAAQVLRDATEKWSKRRIKDFKEDLLYVNLTPIEPPSAPELEKKLKENKSRCRYTEKPVLSEAQLLRDFQIKQEQQDIGFAEIEANDDEEDIEDTESDESLSSNEFEKIIAECQSEYETDNDEEPDLNQPSTSAAGFAGAVNPPKEESSDEWSAPEDNVNGQALPKADENKPEPANKKHPTQSSEAGSSMKKRIPMAQRPSDSSESDEDNEESPENGHALSERMNKKIADFQSNAQKPGSSNLDLLCSSQSSPEDQVSVGQYSESASDDDLPLNQLAAEKSTGSDSKNKTNGAIVILDSDDGYEAEPEISSSVKNKVDKSKKSSAEKNRKKTPDSSDDEEDIPMPSLMYDGAPGIPSKIVPEKAAGLKLKNGNSSSRNNQQKSTLEMLSTSSDDEDFNSRRAGSSGKKSPKKLNGTKKEKVQSTKNSASVNIIDKLSGKTKTTSRPNSEVEMELTRMADENERIRAIVGNARAPKPPKAVTPREAPKYQPKITEFSSPKSSKNALRPNNKLPTGQKRRIQTSVRPLQNIRKRPSTPPQREPPARRPTMLPRVANSEVISLLSDSE